MPDVFTYQRPPRMDEVLSGNEHTNNSRCISEWAQAYPAALEMVERARPKLAALQDMMARGNLDVLFYNPLLEESSAYTFYSEAPREGWLWLKRANTAAAPAADGKMRWHHVFGPVAQLAGWKPGVTSSLLGGPNTLSAALGSGLLGAGMGYGTGWLAEKAMSEDDLRRGRLRKTLALLGGGAATAPALWAGYRGWFDKEASAAALRELYASQRGEGESPLEKEAAPADFTPIIPRDPFNSSVMQDPFTFPQIRAATTGLVSGASALRDNSPWVSPADIARLTVGMGTGYLSGLIVGKTLGALAGLTPEAQRTLQRAGTWAGFLNSVVPMAFGASNNRSYVA